MLGYTKIVAPLAGRTGIRQVDEGNIVHASDTTGIVVITQIRPISVFFSLPQQDIGRSTRAFAKGAARVEALRSTTTTPWSTTARLPWSTTRSTQTTGTVKLKAEFPNATCSCGRASSSMCGS